MARPKNEKLEIAVGEVVRFGELEVLGEVTEVRIIDTAKFVQKFSGDEDEVMVRVRTTLGTALICPAVQEVQKVSDHEAKEYKARFKQQAEPEKKVIQ
jgi:hypothetical protein